MSDIKKFNYSVGTQTRYAKAVEEGTTIEPTETVELDNEQQQRLIKQYRSIIEGQHDKVFLVVGLIGTIAFYLVLPKFILLAIILLIISYITMKFILNKKCNTIVKKLGYIPEIDYSKQFSISKILGGKK